MGITAATPDHISIAGETISWDSLLNHELLTGRHIKKLSAEFHGNQPFPHLIMDGLFSPRLLEHVYHEFDQTPWLDWRDIVSNNETKRGTLPNARLGVAAQLYFHILYTSPFVRFIKQISGIEKLITDPELTHGGMHEIPPGGAFRTHLDFTHHPILGLTNRLVLITYLNKDWKDEYGGQLELCNRDHRCEVSVTPVFGRTVLFMQTDHSFHGHPNPVQEPSGRPRRSVAAYYYSSDQNVASARATGSTEFVGESNQSFRMRNIALSLLPPALVTLGRKIRRQLTLR